jgi:signal transduction histidine kinase
LLSSTDYNLAGFNLTDCDAFKFENIFFQTYYILLGVLAMIWILVLLVRHYRKSTVGFRKEVVLIGIGIEAFLFVFFILSYLGSYLTTIGLLKDSRLEMYGLFGMAFFISLISYTIVKFKAFDIKLIGAQALVWALVILIGSQFFFIQNNVNRVLTAITLVLAAIVGLIIVRSVKKEIAQREELAVANENQQLLIRFITHQVKGFFTKSKMVFASILEGDVGDASEPLKNLVKEGLESDNKAVEMVQEVLKASSLRSGTMTYDLKDEDICPFVNEIAEGFRETAAQKSLTYEVKVPTQNIKVKIDKLQMTQVFKNLIDNSVKYTPTGYVKVSLNVKPDTVLFEIHDSGVGLSDGDKAKLFKEGGRGEESLKVNVNSTGYGLFIVKKIVEGHGGKIWAASSGRGHGSQFYVELPVIK